MIRKTLSPKARQMRDVFLDDIDMQIKRAEFDVNWSLTGLEHVMNEKRLQQLVRKRLSVALFGTVPQ